jgi:tetratricopeptide (TPR) repeat protein
VAIRITASRLASRQGWTVQSIGDRLFDERRRLDELRVGDLDIRATFALSYQDLEAATARTFRLGALSPVNGVEVSAAAALLDRPPGEVEADLDLLVDVNLLESDGPSRYRYHDLLRLYATSLVMTEDPPEARAAAHRRLFDWYLGRVAALAQSQDPNIVRLPTDIPIAADLDDRATEWLDQELPAIVAAVEHAAVHGPRRLAWLLADQLRGFFFGNRHAVHWLATGQAGLAAARAEDDRLAQAAMHQTLGQAYWSIGEFARSLEDYHDGARLAQEVGWQAGAAYMRHNIGLVQLALGQRADAHDSYLRALSLSRGHGLRYVEAVTLNDLGMLRWETGELTEAAEFLDAALRLNREDGNTNGTVANLINLGTVLRELGRLPEARAQLELVIQLCEGARYSLLGVRDELSQIYASSGRVDDAIAFAEEALALARETQDRAYEAAVLTTLGEALLAGGRTTEAVTHLRLSHALACEVGAPFCQIRALVGLTRAATASGDPAAARTAAGSALRGARTGGYRMLEADALLALAGVDAAQGLADAAASGCRAALALYDHSGAVSRAASATALLDSLSRCPAGHP